MLTRPPPAFIIFTLSRPRSDRRSAREARPHRRGAGPLPRAAREHEEADNPAGQASVLDKSRARPTPPGATSRLFASAEKALTIYRALRKSHFRKRCPSKRSSITTGASRRPQQAMTCAREALAIWQELGIAARKSGR